MAQAAVESALALVLLFSVLNWATNKPVLAWARSRLTLAATALIVALFAVANPEHPPISSLLF